MHTQDLAEQARYIMNSGKRIWEWVFQIQTRQLSQLNGKQSGSTLSMAQYQLLLLVNKQPPATISGLATELGVSTPSASAMVDRLVERGILRRRHALDDRRKVLVSLTDEARQKVTEIEAVLQNSFLDLLQKVGPETAGMWCEVLGRVEQCLPEANRRE